MPKKIDLAAARTVAGTLYPPPYDEHCRGRQRTRLGDVAGLTQFGVNRLRLPPGAWSSQRHWHAREDEFVYVLEGEVVLVTNEGEQTLTAGMCAGFPAGTTDGHHMINRSDKPARYLEVGNRDPEDTAHYSDEDLATHKNAEGKWVFTHRDGSAY